MEPTSISEQLLFSTVRIESEGPKGTSAGTAFIFNYEGDKVFLVTNKHVIAGAKRGRFSFTLSDGTKPILGKCFNLISEGFSSAWFGHPEDNVDVAVMPVASILNDLAVAGQNVYYRALPDTLIPTDEQWKELDALEEILFVGYPSGIFDPKNMTPIFRRGITATPLQFDYGGDKIFLIDASVFPGSSGSPVLICNKGSYSPKKGGVVVGSRVFLLGIVSQVMIREEHGKIEIVQSPTNKTPIVKTRQMIDLGIVYKSNTIVETIQEFLKSKGEL